MLKYPGNRRNAVVAGAAVVIAPAAAGTRSGGPLRRAAVCAAIVLLAATAATAARAATKVLIEGNAAITTKDLRRAAAAELAGLEETGRRAAAADDTAFQMEQVYRRSGHPLVDVEYEITGAGASAVVVFRIHEGPLVLLGEVSFSGNAFFPADDLRTRVAREAATPFVEAEVDAGRTELLRLYLEQGFLDVRIRGPEVALRTDRSAADVHFAIEEGTRFVISDVVFAAVTLPEARSVLEELARELQGQPFFGRRGLALRNRVAEVYATQGYPDAAVTVDQEQGAAPGDVVLRVSVATGQRVRIQRVEIVGNTRTRAEYIDKRTPLQPGDWFDQQALREGFQKLYRTGLFSRVGHTLVGEGPERLLQIEVEESPARETSAEVGWGSYEKLRGNVGYRDRNIFGTGRSAGTEVGASLKSRYATADVVDPRFLGSEFSLSFPVSWRFREEPAYTKNEIELSVRLSRKFSGRVSGGVKYGYRFNGLSHLSPDIPPEARDERYSYAGTRVHVDYDGRDDRLYPTRGGQVGLAVEVADQRLGGGLDFLRLTGGGRAFLPLGAGFVLGARLDTGCILPTRGASDIPVGEHFFTGGEGSVRSFEEHKLGPHGDTGDPLGGLASTVLNLEIRRRITGKLAAALFADFGNVAPNRSLERVDLDTATTADLVDLMWEDYLADFRSGVGFGLQYLLPVGPARLDLAWNPDRRADEGEAAFVWHFSIGMAF